MALRVTIFMLLALLRPVFFAQPAEPSTSGAICATAFNDANRNGTRDSGEDLLVGVNESLVVNVGGNSVVIANHLSDTQDSYCFSNLTAGTYSLKFNTPLADPTTPTLFKATLSGTDQIVAQFGAVPHPASVTAGGSGGTSGLVLNLTRTNRLILSIGGAVLAMVFMIGIGLVLFNLSRLLRRRPKPPTDPTVLTH